MDDNYTKGKLRIGTPPPNGEQTIGTTQGLMIAVATTGHGISSKANARRIVACVNACAGLPTDALERGRVVVVTATKFPEPPIKITDGLDIETFVVDHKTAEQRDLLLSALEFLMERIEQPPEPNCSCHISPPCNDCVENAGVREAFEFATGAISKVREEL